jgi:hypothetical protein
VLHVRGSSMAQHHADQLIRALGDARSAVADPRLFKPAPVIRRVCREVGISGHRLAFMTALPLAPPSLPAHRLPTEAPHRCLQLGIAQTLTVKCAGRVVSAILGPQGSIIRGIERETGAQPSPLQTASSGLEQPALGCYQPRGFTSLTRRCIG